MMPSASRLLAVPALLSMLASVALSWPIKTDDYTNGGALCDPDTEHYLQVETYDFHDHPIVTMTWTQTGGRCGETVTNPASWTSTYDSTNGDSGPGTSDRVQLNLFVCCPYGQYRLELAVESYSDSGSTLQQRTSWEIENGPDEYHIWDTVNTYLSTDSDYSPTTPGVYVWPISSATGFYETLWAGPMPPADCGSTVPDGLEYLGCYVDSGSSRTFKQGYYKSSDKGADGMTPELCSTLCEGYDYFGTEYGYECFCGTEAEFNSASTSTNCGTEYRDLCTGDSMIVCGGHSALSVYKRGGSSSTYLGCYADEKNDRDMPEAGKYSSTTMTSTSCISRCSDLGYDYAGTQFGYECWCSDSYGKHGDATNCDISCSGDSSEYCGGYNALSVYEV